MSFLDRNLPPRVGMGPEIRDAPRHAILSWFAEIGLPPRALVGLFLRQEVYSSDADISQDIRTRLGDDAADAFDTEMALQRHEGGAGSLNYPESVLLALPVPWFLVAVECAISANWPRAQESVNEINRVLVKVGANFRFDDAGRAEWHGDEGVYSQVLRPALDALSDPRLSGCASEFQPALRHLAVGTAKDLEDAIEESAKAVESAMIALLEAHRATLNGKETARPLFDLLVEKQICTAEADNAVLAAARIRNSLGGHGTGVQPRVIPSGVPELTVNSAAVAIRYLADLLP